MWEGKPVFVRCAFLAAVVLGVSLHAQAQSPYGLAARQTIPWVIDQPSDIAPMWNTEINIHNPNQLQIRVVPTYLGAVMTPTPGSVSCNPVIIGPGDTAQFSLGSVCSLNPGLNFGRLELSALTPGGLESPSDSIFLASARVSRPGGLFFTVEGFPEGYLSGNRPSAVVTGLKSGLVNGSQWQTFCAGAGLNDPTAVIVHLFDGSGNAIGGAGGAPLDPTSGIEMQTFADVFTAVGAPPGNYSNVSAHFTSLVPPAGVFGFCIVVNASTGERALEVAKYLDDNDEGRQFVTDPNQHAFGAAFEVVSEVDSDQIAASNLHVAYFQHPDRVHCAVTWTSPHSTFDQVQMRLIDPDGQVVAGGAHVNEFRVDLDEKPQRHAGRNGRWLVEVAPDRAYKGNCTAGLLRYVCPGEAELTPYRLTCTSGNGHNELEMIGHCQMACKKDNSKEVLCDFDSPFTPQRCWY
jgi:hypothetical protein